MQIVERCTELRKLDISNTRNITDATLLLIAEKARRLQHLTIRGLRAGITDAGIERVHQKLPQCALHM